MVVATDSDSSAPQDVLFEAGAAAPDRVEVEGTSAEAILAVVAEASAEQRASMIVTVDAPVSSGGDLDPDALIALCSVLADIGVGAVRTTEPTVARRVSSMQAAIAAGTIEVLS